MAEISIMYEDGEMKSTYLYNLEAGESTRQLIGKLLSWLKLEGTPAEYKLVCESKDCVPTLSPLQAGNGAFRLVKKT